MRPIVLSLAVAAVTASSALAPAPAAAQGCVCQRQGGPLFGGVSPYMNSGDWDLQFFYRGFRSTEHFRGTRPLTELDSRGPRNVQHYVTAAAWYGVSRRWNAVFELPLHVNSFDIRRSAPGTPAPVWVPIDASGIGDLALRTRLWALDPDGPRAGARNIGFSAGIKLPTGRNDRTDDYFGRQVPVDVSIQTGDGSWAGTLGLQAFHALGSSVTLFGTGSYLFNPTNTTGVPTFFGSLNNPDNGSLNSAADQFTAQVGASLAVKPAWPQPSLAYRIEGVPISDVIGASDGFRRPGVIGFIEPGLTLAVGQHLFSATMAIRAHVNIRDSPTTTRVEDATVPKFMFTAAWSVRF